MSFGRCLVATFLQGFNVPVGKLGVATNGGQQGTELDTSRRTNCGFDNVPNLGLGAPAVMSRSHPQSAMCFIRKVSNGDCRH